MNRMILACIVLAGLCSMSLAQNDPKGGALVTRVYNVADLVGPARDYPSDSAFVPPTRLKSTPMVWTPQEEKPTNGEAKRPAPAKGIDSLMQLVQETIDPASWMPDAQGVARGRTAVYKTGLVVTQTEANQKAIANLLEQLVNEVGAVRMVSTHLQWVAMKPEQAAAIKSGDPFPANSVKFEAQATCFSGQTISLISGRARTLVIDNQPVVGANTAAYNEDAVLISSGINVQLTPLLTPDQSGAVLDIVAVVGNADNITPTTMPTLLDRVDATAQQLSTSLRLVSGKRSLVGATTPPDVVGSGEQLYLFATVTSGEELK